MLKIIDDICFSFLTAIIVVGGVCLVDGTCLTAFSENDFWVLTIPFFLLSAVVTGCYLLKVSIVFNYCEDDEIIKGIIKDKIGTLINTYFLWFVLLVVGVALIPFFDLNVISGYTKDNMVLLSNAIKTCVVAVVIYSIALCVSSVMNVVGSYQRNSI